MRTHDAPPAAATRPPFSFGRAIYLLWYAPKAGFRHRNREGWINTLLSARGTKQMEQAAKRLPPLPAPDASAATVYFLTGAAFWYQTAFCAYTLATYAEGRVNFCILSDGTLSSAQETSLRHVLTGCEIEGLPAINDRLDGVLPSSKFPTLRARRIAYPHLRKLTDVHTRDVGWKLVLDSDMLFHHRPATILSWLDNPVAPIHLRDIATAYGYSDALLREMAGGDVPEQVNVGVCGLRGEHIDWERLEHWCRVLIEREGSHYLQEQALTAMLLTGKHIEIPLKEGIVCPTRAETLKPTASLHHYVAESKAWYFRDAWRLVMSRIDSDVR